MVNFSAKLQDNTRQEWAEHYIDYKALKKLLKPLKKGAPPKKGGSMIGHYGGAEASDSDEEPSTHHDFVRDIKDRLMFLSKGGKAKAKLKKPAAAAAAAAAAVVTPTKSGAAGGAGEQKPLLLTQDQQRRNFFYGGGGGAAAAPPTSATEEGLATHKEEEGGKEGEEEGEEEGDDHALLSPDERGRREGESEKFEAVLCIELEKVERFYEDTTTDLGQQLGFLKAQLRGDGSKNSQLALDDLTSWAHPMSDEDKKRAKQLGPKERELIETTLIRLNREMTLLENYCIINYTGFIKILKKHDKLMPSRPLRPALLPQLEHSHFFQHQRLEAIKKEVTAIFADVFCNRDKQQAAAMLLPKRFRTNLDYFLLHLGYKLGKFPPLFSYFPSLYPFRGGGCFAFFFTK